MRIRKAKKEDFQEYLKLKREEERDLTKYLKTKIGYPEDKILKYEFFKILRDKKAILLVAEDKEKLIAYIYSTIFKNIYSKGGYIEDIFVSKEVRKKGIAKTLINTFVKTVKQRGYKKIHLSVNIKNKKAIELYRKLGFEIYHYDLKKEWK